SAKGFFHLAGNICHAADPFDAVILVGALWILRRPLLIVINQRCGLVVINRQAITHRRLLIIFTLDKRLTGHIVFTRLFGWIVLNVINPARGLVNTTPR